MIQTAPDVKPLLPGRHPFLPRQPPAALPTMTPMMTPQMAPLPMLPSSPRYLSPVQESRIDAWRKTTSAGAPSAAEHEAPAVPAPPPPPHSCPNCGPPSAHDKKSKSAPASLAPKSYRSHHQHSHPHSCADSSEAGTRSAGTSQVQTASPVDSRHATGPAYVNDPPSPISGGSYGRSYYSTKKHRHARREQRMASQSAPHPGASQPLDAASILYEEAPPHNWGAEMNYTPRAPVVEREPATIANRASPRIAGARDPISQKYWRAMFPPPAPGGGLM